MGSLTGGGLQTACGFFALCTQESRRAMSDLAELEAALRKRIRSEEASYARRDRKTDSLWGHLERVARLAEALGRKEGADPQACRLAGLFHDAGKFAAGQYHQGEVAEEELSVAVLRELTQQRDLPAALVEEVGDAILQLYRDDPDPSPLAQVLFDADNLDKLGPLGVANYFVKSGLRGRGVSGARLFGITVELTYARHAQDCLHTAAGRDLARRRAAQTRRYFCELLDSLREDGLYDFRISQVVHDGLVLDVAAPERCTCGVSLDRRAWQVPGIKCNEIHLEHACASCGFRHELRFCRPRLLS